MSAHLEEETAASSGMTVQPQHARVAIVGAGFSGLGHSSMIFLIESQLAYILDCLRQMDRRHARAVVMRGEVQASFNEEIRRRMSQTVWTSGCASWYLDANRHNTALWPGFTWECRRRTRRFDVASCRVTSAS